MRPRILDLRFAIFDLEKIQGAEQERGKRQIWDNAVESFCRPTKPMISSMKFSKIAVLFVLGSLLVLSNLGADPLNQTTSPIPGAVPSPEWNWGMPTNGICGSAQVVCDTGISNLPIIDVRVINTNLYGFRGEKEPDPHDALAVFHPVIAGAALYFAPTNSFCGPVELKDGSGRLVPLLKPEFSKIESYPPSFSVTYAKEHNPRTNSFFPVALLSSADSLIRFQLGDYFDVRAPGDYQLTVWPKIYKRPDTNSDNAQRIDLPPVSVNIHWTGSTNR
jgi:hypothetical protein